jgi:hypothetical protein
MMTPVNFCEQFLVEVLCEVPCLVKLFACWLIPVPYVLIHELFELKLARCVPILI